MSARLDVKKWIYASIAVFVVYSILEYIANQLIFMPSYPEMFPGTPAEESLMLHRVWMYLGRAIFSVMFAFIYTKGFEGKAGFGEGLRYGLWIALLVPVPVFFRNLVISSAPGGLTVNGMLTSVLELIILGIIVGLTYRAPARLSAD